jgi:hypothetical protein
MKTLNVLYKSMFLMLSIMCTPTLIQAMEDPKENNPKKESMFGSLLRSLSNRRLTTSTKDESHQESTQDISPILAELATDYNRALQFLKTTAQDEECRIAAQKPIKGILKHYNLLDKDDKIKPEIAAIVKKTVFTNYVLSNKVGSYGRESVIYISEDRQNFIFNTLKDLIQDDKNSAFLSKLLNAAKEGAKLEAANKSFARSLQLCDGDGYLLDDARNIIFEGMERKPRITTEGIRFEFFINEEKFKRSSYVPADFEPEKPKEEEEEINDETY